MENFSGFLESDISDSDFFAAAEEQEKQEEERQEEDTEKEKKETIKEENQEEDFFDIADEEEESEEDEEEDKPKRGEKTNIDTKLEEGESIATLNLLKKRGLIDYELEEDEELTAERAEEILEDSLDNMFEDRIEELFSEVPEIVKDMNKFVLKGGDINEFLESISKQNKSGIKEGLDLEEEANQELVVREALKEEGYDSEYIKAQIEFLKDSNRLKSHSETHYKKWEAKYKEEQRAILKSREEAIEKEKLDKRKLKAKVSDFLKQTEEVSGFPISYEDRKQLPDYMTERTVKLDNGNTITNMQRDLMRVLNSPVGSIQIAKLLKAANADGELSFEEIKKETETKVTKKVRENVRRNKNSIISNSAEGKNSKKRPLADYFN